MKSTTINLIKAALRMDPTVTPDIRMAVIEAMMGERKPVGELDGDVSLAEAAGYLNMSRVTLWRQASRGEIPAVRRGKKFFIAAGDLARMKEVC